MTTPISSSSLKKAATAGVAKDAPIAAKVRPAEVDHLSAPGLVLHPVQRKPLGELSEPVSGRVLSSFPIDDLAKLGSSGRWAVGFRLDGGALRCMWLAARRAQEKNGSPSIELSFQAHGPSAARLQRRLLDKGAKSARLPFEAACLLPGDDPTTARPQKTGETWSPPVAGLKASQEGKWVVDFAATEPEALKGTLRIKLLGTDAECTSSLKEVVNRFGLQAMLAPPTPATLERFKLFRLLWAEAPELAERLRYRSFEEMAEALEAALLDAGLPPDQQDRVAISRASFDDPNLADRVRLMRLLYRSSPSAFFEWLKKDKSSRNGALPASPGSDPNSNLAFAINFLGISTASEAYQSALTAPLGSDASARRVLELGLLLRKDFALGTEVVQRDADAVKVEDLEKFLEEAGIDAKGERRANLRFEEVYPGYFTVIDPALPERLYRAGARYLYSTTDSPERVYDILTGGQKSSVARFREGLIVQGKSSAADFGTGGAASVFTRLVTRSAIRSAKKEPTTHHAFLDWGGTRPYKVVLNRRILGRLDWYGFHKDSYGRSTGVTKANKLDRIVRSIDEAYLGSNELMFPVGNDPAYVDLVVCKTEEQRAALIHFLSSKGIEEFNGRSVGAFVKVSECFFDHPDDETLAASIENRVLLELDAKIMETIDAKTAELATPAIEGAAPAVAQLAAQQQLLSTARRAARPHGLRPAEAAARSALSHAPAELIAALGLEALRGSAATAAKEAAADAVELWASDTSHYSLEPIEQALRKVVESKSGELKELAKGGTAQLDDWMHSALSDAAIAEAQATVDGESGAWSLMEAAKKAGETAAIVAAMNAAPTAALESLRLLAEGPAQKAAQEAVQMPVISGAEGWIKPGVEEATLREVLPIAEAAAQAAIDAALAAHTAQAVSVAQVAAAAFQETHPDLPANPEQVKALAKAAIADLAAPMLNTATKRLAETLLRPIAAQAAKTAVEYGGAELRARVAEDLARIASRSATEAFVRDATQAGLAAVWEPAIKEGLLAITPVIASQLIEAALANLRPELEKQWAAWALEHG